MTDKCFSVLCYGVNASCDDQGSILHPDTGSHMPVIMGACLFIKMTARRDLPPFSSCSVTTFCVVNWSSRAKTLSGIWFWWPLTQLWVYRGESRGKKINMCIDTNDNNVHRNLITTYWTLIQYFHNAADNVSLEYVVDIWLNI